MNNSRLNTRAIATAAVVGAAYAALTMLLAPISYGALQLRVSEAPSYGKPAILYDLKCAGSQAYLQLASEVIQRERQRKAA